MKKLYTLLIALLAINSAMAQGCLPEGITFTTQEQIDNFQTDYPGCTQIVGNVFLIGNNSEITNLNGLNVITSVGGNLTINFTLLETLSGLDNLNYVGGQLYIGYNDSLNNLSGLDNLDTIGAAWIVSNSKLSTLENLGNLVHVNGDLILDGLWSLKELSGLESLATINGGMYFLNTAITNLEGLEGLSFVGEYIHLLGNPNLVSLSGIDYANLNSLKTVSFIDNNSLTTCEVQSICNIIDNPEIEKYIENNAPGCNSREEVEAACLVGLENIIQENKLSLYPNPSSSHFTIQFSLENKEQVKLIVLNNLGQVVATLANETLSAGQHELNWNAEGMPAGVYFYNIQIGNQVGTGKMVLMK